MRTLLIVEGTGPDRHIPRGALGADYIIEEASSSEEAFGILKEKCESISAVLLDAPCLDCFKLIKSVREDARTASIPIIMLTAAEDEEARTKALSLGVSDFVLKPYSIERIKHCLKNNIAFREAAATVDALKRDKVTGLYTREAFFDMVKKAVAEKEPGYYIMASFDIDSFKVINDQYGTEKGDSVLRHVADSFIEGFDTHGGICCRISADDFAVLYPTSFQYSEEIAKVRWNASHIEGFIFPIIFSIGRYIIDDVTLSPAAMYDRASLAASMVKRRYDNKIAVYDENMRERLIREQDIVMEMEFALRDRQFEVWFQPQYNHSTDAMIGAEAVVRWRHPQKGLMQPGDFIPIFEQNGFIYELDKFVWEEVARYFRKWIDEGRSPLPVSVNISRYDIFREDIIESITGLVKKYGFPVSMLRLEITESAFADTSERVVSVVRELIDLGFTVEIDDFGSGYSSLNTLKDVPAQIIKLDVKFFDSSGDTQRGGNIVESVVRMAKWLGMAVIAEGVETLEQANFLRSVGCNYIQGYLYAHPMPAERYEAHCSGSEKEEKLLTLETVENLDNNAFWDAASMDTLIFNSYVGAACIYEYHDGNVELLRATDKYAQVIGSIGTTVEDALKLNWSDHLDSTGMRRVKEALEYSISSKKEVTDEFVFHDLPGCPHETYLRSTMRVIATAGDRYLVYCTNENITAQKQSEKREHEISEQLQAIMQNLDNGVSASIIKDGKLTPLFANDSYYRILGYTKRDYERQFNGIPYAILPDDRKRVMDISAKVAWDSKPKTVEFRILRRDGEIRLLRSHITAMEYPGISDMAQLAVTTDITEQREAEHEIKRLSDQMQSIMDNVDLGIIAVVLEEDSSRYLFANDHYYAMLGYTKEQFAREVFSPYQTIYSLDLARVMERTERLNHERGSDVIEYRVNTRDGRLRYFRAIVSIGYFADVDLPVQLSIVRDITEERELEEREREALEQIQNMMDDMPGGFVRMRMYDDGSIKPEYFNKGFSKLMGMSYTELMDTYADDVMANVHPDDVPVIERAVADMMKHGEAKSSRYRLKRGDGSYIWLVIFGRVTRKASGETYLNIYYSDATREVKAEEQSKELLDNLPYGAALYLIEDGELSAVHFNRRYWELVGRSEKEYAASGFLSMVYPSDRDNISRELTLAMREKRDIVCDVRIMCGDNEYRPFHVVGRMLQREDGRSYIYAAYTPITPEAMSVQEMLPIALSAMMDSQTDFSFVKDKNLRYICCSRGAAALAGLSSALDIQGMTDEELFERSLALEFTSDDRHVLDEGKALVDIISRIPSTDGKGHYASTSKYPLKDGEGNIVGLYGVGRDITESRAIKSQYELLTNSIPGGIAAYEVDSGHIRITFFSDGFCKLFGVTREEYERISAKSIFAGVFNEDLPELMKQAAEFTRDNVQMDCIFRVNLMHGGFKWINIKAAFAEREGDKVIFNAVLFDVTQRQEAIEHLRISEEENRLAMQHTSNTILRYDVLKGTLALPKRTQDEYRLPETVERVPESQVESGLISRESADVYTAFYDGIRRGDETGSATFQRMSATGWRWLEGHYSTILADDGKPVSAVVSFVDVTEQIEKDAAYKRWKQSLMTKKPGSYSLFRYNLSSGKFFDTREGSLIEFDFAPGTYDFNGNTAKYTAERVFADDAERFAAAVNTDALLSGYYQGKRVVTLEYREKLEWSDVRWLRLTIDMVELTSSSDIEAYLLFEDIDKAKRQELATIEQAQTDPLTGVLNRVTFAAKVNALIGTSKPNTQHALLILDVDGFKQVNDAFGHAAGDQALIDIADSLRKALRHDDLIGRLGGDEYLTFLTDIPGDFVAAAKAKQICAATRKAFSAEVEISGSIGVTVMPRDGGDFDSLYKKADAALYHVKDSGKDNFAFYHEDLAEQKPEPLKSASYIVETTPKKKKRRMLIVDDSRIDHVLLANIFADDFIIEKAKNGSDAMIRLRHYGTAISVVLLDLMMPGMDGFAVLKKLQESSELQSVPVIVVSSDENKETNLRAIKSGAVDFVSKPVDPEILKIRVESAISKAENERLRAKNSFLEYQNSTVIRYKTALESSGVVVIENDWVSGTFVYDSTIGEHFAGNFDDRSFWHILLSDFVAETHTV